MSIEALVFYILRRRNLRQTDDTLRQGVVRVRHFRTISRWFPPAEGWATLLPGARPVGQLAPVPRRHANPILTITPDRPIFSGTSG